MPHEDSEKGSHLPQVSQSGPSNLHNHEPDISVTYKPPSLWYFTQTAYIG